jgi:hypothetical protein
LQNFCKTLGKDWMIAIFMFFDDDDVM